MEGQAFHWLLMIVGILGSMAAFTTVQRFFAPPPPDDAGLAGLAPKQPGQMSAFDSINPNGGFVDRLDWFFVHNIGLGPKLEGLHMLLGAPEKPTALTILHWKEACMLTIPAFLCYMAEGFIPLILMPVCFMIPDWYLGGRIKERQDNIIRNFPSLVDLAALTIESGLDYMTAFDRIIKQAKKKTELEVEFEKTISEVQLGYSRREALRRMAMRTGLQDIRSFVGLIIQSDELGTSLVDLLRSYAADMRFRRLNKAEKVAAQAATKMLIPIFLFIFPTVFILMLAPMMMNLFQGGLGF
ncbi:MAG: type II secretion system F family protein [Elusimicrobia bacterium]|nr:type II secretion system F family protein [Elusimicrobiota bacterium]